MLCYVTVRYVLRRSISQQMLRSGNPLLIGHQRTVVCNISEVLDVLCDYWVGRAPLSHAYMHDSLGGGDFHDDSMGSIEVNPDTMHPKCLKSTVERS